MKKEQWSPWLVLALALVASTIVAVIIVFLSFLALRSIHRVVRSPSRPTPFSQQADLGSNGVLRMAFGSGMGFPGGTFEDRGRRLMTRRIVWPAPSRSPGLVRPPEVLGAGQLSAKGRKAYYQAVLAEVQQPGGAVHIIAATVLVDCPERRATGAIGLSLRVPGGRPVGPLDLRGTPADPQFLSDELELSSANLCVFR